MAVVVAFTAGSSRYKPPPSRSFWGEGPARLWRMAVAVSVMAVTRVAVGVLPLKLPPRLAGCNETPGNVVRGIGGGSPLPINHLATF